MDWTTHRFKAGIASEELYNTQNAFNLLPRTDITLEYILGVINSELMNFAHSTLFLDESKLRFQKILIKDARQFPIRRIAFTTPAADRARHLDEGKRRYKAYWRRATMVQVLAFVAERLAHEPEQSDVIHDLLAYLAEEMIRLNKEKRAEQQRYLDGLVAALHVLPIRMAMPDWTRSPGRVSWPTIRETTRRASHR